MCILCTSTNVFVAIKARRETVTFFNHIRLDPSNQTGLCHNVRYRKRWYNGIINLRVFPVLGLFRPKHRNPLNVFLSLHEYWWNCTNNSSRTNKFHRFNFWPLLGLRAKLRGCNDVTFHTSCGTASLEVDSITINTTHSTLTVVYFRTFCIANSIQEIVKGYSVFRYGYSIGIITDNKLLYHYYHYY